MNDFDRGRCAQILDDYPNGQITLWVAVKWLAVAVVFLLEMQIKQKD